MNNAAIQKPVETYRRCVFPYFELKREITPAKVIQEKVSQFPSEKSKRAANVNPKRRYKWILSNISSCDGSKKSDFFRLIKIHNEKRTAPNNIKWEPSFG
ncbi:hypothetical protein LEP1GSC198_1012 [Leptospira kirschneri str. JB]|nr:hypothetical protein LEP1GSC198_1012 [Leptospira kirschneri str. JB]